MKILFYSNSKILSIVKFKNIGITLRKLYGDEIEKIVETFMSYFNNYNVIDNYKKYVNCKSENLSDWEKEYNILKFASEMGENEKNAILYLYSKEKEGILINEEKIREETEKIIVIEIEENKFTKYFDLEFAAAISTKLLNFSNYLNDTNGDFEYKSMSAIKFDMFLEENSQPYFLTLIDTPLNLFNDFNVDKLIKFSELLNYQNEEFNFNFIPLIDLLLTETSLPENELVNMVSTIERLLIKDSELKEKSFILKVGMLCNNLFEDVDNKRLSKQLKSIYEIRSNIVHGDDYKNMKSIEKYENIFNYDNKMYKNENKYVKRRMFLTAVNVYLKIYVVSIFNKYLENPKLCEYIKNN